VRAWWARRNAQAKLRHALIADQRSLDGVLGELGRAAHDERLDVPAVRDEMKELGAVEERRALAESETLAAREKRSAEAQRFGRMEWACDEAVVEQERVVEKSERELRGATDRRRDAQGDVARIDGELAALQRTAAAAEARLATAPQPSDQRAAIEAEVRDARARQSELDPRRQQAAARATELDAPVAALTQSLADDRLELSRRKRALAAAVAERAHALEAIDEQLKRLAAEQQSAAAEIARRHVTIGTLLNLNRVERDRFSPLYARIDELKVDLTEREALIARLEDERKAFDHAAAQHGVIVVAASLGGVVVLAVVLLLLLGGR
jgi:uncharacterized coiled-coil protein SlyX